MAPRPELSPPPPEPPRAEEQVSRAVLHLEGAVRAYAGLALQAIEQRLHANLAQLASVAILAGAVLLGLMLVVLGLGQALDVVLGYPGIGRFVLGLLVLAIAAPLLRAAVKEQSK